LTGVFGGNPTAFAILLPSKQVMQAAFVILLPSKRVMQAVFVVLTGVESKNTPL
jgi:hypothetical protein